MSPPRATTDLSALELVSRETMGTRVYTQLREAIMTGRFAPGQLLSLRSVAEAVGSSTMPVRAALTRLQAEGALVDGPGRALMVPPMTLDLLDELRDVRIALEGAVAKRAASRMTPTRLAALQTIFDTMNTQVETSDVSGFLRSNFQFHIAIYTHGASDLTLATIQSLWVRIGPFFNFVAPDIAHMRRSMTAHRHILEALLKGDGEGARAGIQEDIEDAAAYLQAHLQRGDQAQASA